jgi:hypothetical protein
MATLSSQVARAMRAFYRRLALTPSSGARGAPYSEEHARHSQPTLFYVKANSNI